MKLALLLLTLCCMAGCAASRSGKLVAVMDGWVGKPVTSAIGSLGPPSLVYDEAPYKVYVWHTSNTSGGKSFSYQAMDTTKVDKDSGTGFGTKTVTHTVPVRTLNTYKMFWVGSDGTVVRWKTGRQK